jgi:segregation and condensation protein B
MENLSQIIESILFVAGDSVAFLDIADKLQVEVEEVKKTVEELKAAKEQSLSGIQVLIFNEKAQLCSNPDYATQVSEVLNPIKEKALTKAVLEVAAIIAYKQPITRLEVENVRGVNSDYAINCLVENNLIEIVGRKDAVGKPLLFGTTDNFLKKFGLSDIADLPDYEELVNRIKVLHSTDEGNSLFNFRDTEDDITKEEEILKGEKTLTKEEELIENNENNLDTEKLKQEILADKSNFEDILGEDKDEDYLKYID